MSRHSITALKSTATPIRSGSGLSPPRLRASFIACRFQQLSRQAGPSDWREHSDRAEDEGRRLRIPRGVFRTVPKLPGDRPHAYAVYVDDKGKVWVSDFGANAILSSIPRERRSRASRATNRTPRCVS